MVVINEKNKMTMKSALHQAISDLGQTLWWLDTYGGEEITDDEYGHLWENIMLAQEAADELDTFHTMVYCRKNDIHANNIHNIGSMGSSFDEFLDEEDIKDDVMGSVNDNIKELKEVINKLETNDE